MQDVPSPSNFSVVAVSGLSGAGKSTAINVFEDMGFYCVDGLPLNFLPDVARQLLDSGSGNYRGLAVGLDLRQKGFFRAWREVKRQFEDMGIELRGVFVEAASQVIVQRYAQTRRPHPLESDEVGLEQALIREREGLSSFREEADLVLDTSSFSIHDLRRNLQRKWDAVLHGEPGMRLHIISFGFKYGVPLEADMLIDLRFLPNPYFEPDLRPLTGEEKTVYNYVLGGDMGRNFIHRFKEFLDFLLPLYQEEGRYRLTLALGCTGGMHRSVSVALALSEFLRTQGYALSLEHRHIQWG